jgi:hypothetical protein
VPGWQNGHSHALRGIISVYKRDLGHGVLTTQGLLASELTWAGKTEEMRRVLSTAMDILERLLITDLHLNDLFTEVDVELLYDSHVLYAMFRSFI